MLYKMQCRLKEWRSIVVISCTNVIREHDRKRLTEERDSEKSLFERVRVVFYCKDSMYGISV